MKEKELRERTDCTFCGNKIGSTGLPVFWTAKIQRHMVDLNAIKRQDGLAQMIGSPALAGVMGPDEEMTKPMGEWDVTVCEDCASKMFYQLLE